MVVLETKRTYKLRKITTNNFFGDSFGITIPKKVAVKFKYNSITYKTNKISAYIHKGGQHGQCLPHQYR